MNLVFYIFDDGFELTAGEARMNAGSHELTQKTL